MEVEKANSQSDALIEGTTQTAGDAEEELTYVLASLGLPVNEAKVYVHLAHRGCSKAREVSEGLGIHKTETYHLLNGLQSKGLVKATFQYPIRFMAVPFATALNLLVEAQRQRLMLIEKQRGYFFNLSNSLVRQPQPTDQSESFQILVGMNRIYVKACEMLTRTKRQLQISAAEGDVMRMDLFGLIDKLKTLTRRNITCELLTARTPSTAATLRNVNWIQLHYVPHDVSYLPHFILCDGEQLLFFVRASEVPRKEASALWTNHPVFVKIMELFFPFAVGSLNHSNAEMRTSKPIQNA